MALVVAQRDERVQPLSTDRHHFASVHVGPLSVNGRGDRATVEQHLHGARDASPAELRTRYTFLAWKSTSMPASASAVAGCAAILRVR